MRGMRTRPKASWCADAATIFSERLPQSWSAEPPARAAHLVDGGGPRQGAVGPLLRLALQRALAGRGARGVGEAPPGQHAEGRAPSPRSITPRVLYPPLSRAATWLSELYGRTTCKALTCRIRYINMWGAMDARPAKARVASRTPRANAVDVDVVPLELGRQVLGEVVHARLSPRRCTVTPRWHRLPLNKIRIGMAQIARLGPTI
jgi:hypothetical protein